MKKWLNLWLYINKYYYGIKFIQEQDKGFKI